MKYAALFALIMVTSCGVRNEEADYRELVWEKHFDGVHVAKLTHVSSPNDLGILLGNGAKSFGGGLISMPTISKDTKVMIARWVEGIVFEKLEYVECNTECSYGGQSGMRIDLYNDAGFRAVITGYNP